MHASVVRQKKVESHFLVYPSDVLRMAYTEIYHRRRAYYSQLNIPGLACMPLLPSGITSANTSEYIQKPVGPVIIE